MTVKQLINILRTLEQDAIIDISIDEEGNGFGDISNQLAEGMLKNGKKVYSLYPDNAQLPEDRYQY